MLDPIEANLKNIKEAADIIEKAVRGCRCGDSFLLPNADIQAVASNPGCGSAGTGIKTRTKPDTCTRGGQNGT